MARYWVSSSLLALYYDIHLSATGLAPVPVDVGMDMPELAGKRGLGVFENPGLDGFVLSGGGKGYLLPVVGTGVGGP